MSNFIDKKEKKLCGGNSMENDKEYQKWLNKVTVDEYNLKSIPFDFQDEIAEKNDFDMGGGYTIPRNR